MSISVRACSAGSGTRSDNVCISKTVPSELLVKVSYKYLEMFEPLGVD